LGENYQILSENIFEGIRLDHPTPFARKELVGNRVLLTPIRNKNRLGQTKNRIDRHQSK
jgi:predicted FMN-binding regulatory protein PaiB